MIKLRPYKPADAKTILSWCRDEREFYRWTAGVMGEYPISDKEFAFVETLMPFTAFDESGIVGFFSLRNFGRADELRFGFVIVNPEKRGKGYGKEMLRLGFVFAFDVYRAKRVSIGVFEDNKAAYNCYKSLGFKENRTDNPEIYHLMDEDWKCLELSTEKTLDVHTNL